MGRENLGRSFFWEEGGGGESGVSSGVTSSGRSRSRELLVEGVIISGAGGISGASGGVAVKGEEVGSGRGLFSIK